MKTFDPNDVEPERPREPVPGPNVEHPHDQLEIVLAPFDSPDDDWSDVLEPNLDI